MRIAILGSGGVGGYYGALLAQSGQQVAFIGRGKHLQAIQEHGLDVRSLHGDFKVQPAQATDDPAQVGVVDLVLFTVKSYDLLEAAESAHSLFGPHTVALPLLNGLDAVDQLSAIMGREQVLAGLTHISSSIAAPGLIRQVSKVRRITFGEQDGRISPRSEHIRDVLSLSGIQAVLTQDVQTALWDKFIFIASISGVCCLARQPIGPILGTPESRQLLVNALQEVEAVGQARGVALSSNIVASTLELAEGFAPETKPSLLVDLEAGRRLELEALSGTVVRYGRASSVATPVHDVIYAALKPNLV
jgi:2-dehydropantoate 2-reductase